MKNSSMELEREWRVWEENQRENLESGRHASVSMWLWLHRNGFKLEPPINIVSLQTVFGLFWDCFRVVLCYGELLRWALTVSCQAPFAKSRTFPNIPSWDTSGGLNGPAESFSEWTRPCVASLKAFFDFGECLLIENFSSSRALN